MSESPSRYVSRAEFYAAISTVFVILVAVFHAPRAPRVVQDSVTVFLIVVALAALFVAWRARRAV